MIFDEGTYQFSYTISTLNREEEAEEGFRLSILFEGSKEPKKTIVADGVGVREFSYDNSPARIQAQRKALFTVLGIIAGAVIIPLFILAPFLSFLGRPLEKKLINKQAQSFYEVSRNSNLSEKLNDNELKELITEMLYQKDSLKWEKMSWINKWSSAMMSPPKKEDYRIE